MTEEYYDPTRWPDGSDIYFDEEEEDRQRAIEALWNEEEDQC